MAITLFTHQIESGILWREFFFGRAANLGGHLHKNGLGKKPGFVTNVVNIKHKNPSSTKIVKSLFPKLWSIISLGGTWLHLCRMSTPLFTKQSLFSIPNLFGISLHKHNPIIFCPSQNFKDAMSLPCLRFAKYHSAFKWKQKSDCLNWIRSILVGKAQHNRCESPTPTKILKAQFY